MRKCWFLMLLGTAVTAAEIAPLPAGTGFRCDGQAGEFQLVSVGFPPQTITPEMIAVKEAAGSDGGGTLLQTPHGRYRFTRTVELNADSVRFQGRIVPDTSGVPDAKLEFRLLLPVADTAESPLWIDGKRYGFPRDFTPGTSQRLVKDAGEIVVPRPNGLLVFTGKFDVVFQDNRKWQQPVLELRLGAVDTAEAGALGFSLVFEPYQDTPLPLAKCANMGFRDEVADDGMGGWTDQGPSNDLRMFPVGRQRFCNVTFDIVDPVANGGKACLGMAGPERPSFLKTAELMPPSPVTARFLHLVTGTAWPKIEDAGTVTVEYADGRTPPTVQTIRNGVHTGNFWACAWLPEGVMGWKGKNFYTDIALYQTAIPLKHAPVKRISIQSSGKQVWMIAAASLSNRPLAGIDADSNTIVADGVNWKELRSTMDMVPGGILDFHRPEEAPAGKHGFLRVAGDHFEFEKRPGEPVRFYGANVCFYGCFMSRGDADRMADHLAWCGYNAVRLHHFDELLTLNQKHSTDFDPARLDELDYLVAALKQRGVYITLDFFTLRPLPQAELSGVKVSQIRDEVKLLTYVNASVRDNMYTFAAKLMNHVNPYTGLAWKDEPAITHVSLLNENTLFDLLNLFPEAKRQYEQAFRESPAGQKRYASAGDEERARRTFYTEIFQKGFQDFRNYLRKLGVRVPLTDFNCGNTGLVYPIRETRDYVDNHFYFDHPVFLGNNWGLPYQISNRSSMDSLIEPLTETASSRIFGKPFTVTEWNFCFPNSYAVEGAFLTGAYAALQDWSGLYRFVYTDKNDNITGAGAFELTMFDVVDDPVRLLSERAGVCFFRRGDVRAATPCFPTAISRDLAALPDADFRMGDSARLGMFLGRIGATVGTATSAVPLNSATVTPLDSGMAARQWPVPVLSKTPTGKAFLAALAEKSGLGERCFQPNPFLLVSATGELALEPDAEKFTVATPYSEGVLLKTRGAADLPFLRIANRDGFAAFLAAATDGKPLLESKRILLLHLTESKNSGMVFSESRRQVVDKLGKVPVLIRRGNAEVTLKRPLAGFHLYAVDLTGKRTFEVPLKTAGANRVFDADTFAAHGVTLAYELVEDGNR
ncbi:MAG: hypothetical protein WC708_02135 [Lentisphaeria bacterium]